MIVINSLRWFSRNLGLFFLSFILAVAVWLTAVVTTDPDLEQTYPQPIPIEYIGPGESFVVTNKLPTAVQVSLRAPQSVWDALLADRNAIQVTVDLSALDTGTYQLAPQVMVSAHPVRVESISPQRITVVLEPLLTREVAITPQVTGEPAPGFQAAPLLLSRSRVSVTGPQSLVERVSEARVAVDISGVRADVKSVVPVHLFDANGAEVTGLAVTPREVRVTQPIRQLGGYRDVAVKVVITGSVASGYRITNLTVSPPVVTVSSSDPKQVNELPGFVETEPLDLTDAVDDLDKRLALALPEGISVVGDQSVLVHVSIAAIEGSLNLSLPVEVIGLDPTLQATLSPETVDVIVSGPLPVLDTLTPADLRVTVDVSGLGEGVHQLEPQVEVLKEHVSVEIILPATVEVTIGPQPTPTATPTATVTPGP